MRPSLDELLDCSNTRSGPRWMFMSQVSSLGTRIFSVKQNVKNTLKLEVRDAEGDASHIGVLVKSSGIYALASLAVPLVTLVLAPFLTHTLSLADYGVLAVLSTAITLMAGLTQFGLNNAFFRAYSFDYQSSQERVGVLSTVVVLLLLSSIPITIGAVLVAPWLAALLFNNLSYSDLIRLAALVVLLQNFTVPGFSLLRAESRAGLYATLSIIDLLIVLGATVVLVGMLHMGIAGALIAMIAGYTVVVGCTLPSILLRAGLRLHFEIAWNLLSFGLPLVSNLVAIWFLQLSDRYLLSRFGSLSQTASYTVAYSLGGMLGVVVLSPFSLAWPITMFAVAKREDAVDIFRHLFRWYSIVLLFATFGLLLISISALYMLFPPSYYAAEAVIPIVAVSIMFFGMYSFITIGISIRRKTWFAVILTTVAALANVGLNMVLIPRYGSIGAAVSTLIAYVLLASSAYIVNQRLYPIPFEIGTFLVALLVGIVFCIGCGYLFQLSQLPRVYAIALYLCNLSLYGGFLVFLGKHPIQLHKYVHPKREGG